VAAASPSNGAPQAESLAATDPLFKAPYIDIDEWREAPVRHRYVHGGFKGTDTRFSFYFRQETVFGAFLPVHHTGPGQ